MKVREYVVVIGPEDLEAFALIPVEKKRASVQVARDDFAVNLTHPLRLSFPNDFAKNPLSDVVPSKTLAALTETQPFVTDECVVAYFDHRDERAVIVFNQVFGIAREHLISPHRQNLKAAPVRAMENMNVARADF